MICMSDLYDPVFSTAFVFYGIGVPEFIHWLGLEGGWALVVFFF